MLLSNKSLLLVLCTFVMGFFTAIPPGATQIEIARRSLNGYPFSALMIVFGSVLSDAMYGVIAFFAVAPFLQDSKVMAGFWIVNASILIFLGIFVIRQSSRRQTMEDIGGSVLPKKNIAFFTGFSLAVTNPLMIVWWLLGARIMSNLGLFRNANKGDTVLLLVAGSIGFGTYLTLLTFGVYRAKKFLSKRFIRSATAFFGAALLCLALYSLVEAAIEFSK
jgi:threonine/homoserine/homoserine lactone efflux protein